MLYFFFKNLGVLHEKLKLQLYDQGELVDMAFPHDIITYTMEQARKVEN